MSIYLQLFLIFLEVGAVSFGGGYGMIALMQEKTVGLGLLTEESFLNMIAIAESTPGPIAVNIATFVGASQGGILGALCATIGIILPSFIIIIVIAALIGNLLKFAGVKSVIGGMKPAVTAIIFCTALTMLLKALISVKKIGDEVQVSWVSIIIFIIVGACSFGYKRLFKKQISPILLIIISAVLGICLCPLLGV